MSIEIVGLAHHNASTLVSPRPADDLDLDYIVGAARSQEAAGFDRVLVANTAVMPDSLSLGGYITAKTERLGVMLAHRPGIVAPTMAARMFATLDRTSRGRVAAHIIAGADDLEVQADGDFLTKDQRYYRAAEYVDVMRRVWSSAEPFDHEGDFYRFRGAYAQVRPAGRALPVYWGGSSDLAISLAGRCADIYAMPGDTLAAASELAAKAHAAAAAQSRSIAVLMTMTIILGETESEAWGKAERLLQDVTEARRPAEADADDGPKSVGMQRLLDRSAEGEHFDRCLWTGLNKALRARGNNTTLVGTPDQIIDSLVDYHAAGIGRYLLRGFDVIPDAERMGREVIPSLRRRLALVSGQPNSQPSEASKP